MTGSMLTLHSFVELTPPRAVALKEAAKKVPTKILVWGIGNVLLKVMNDTILVPKEQR